MLLQVIGRWGPLVNWDMVSISVELGAISCKLVGVSVCASLFMTAYIVDEPAVECGNCKMPLWTRVRWLRNEPLVLKSLRYSGHCKYIMLVKITVLATSVTLRVLSLCVIFCVVVLWWDGCRDSSHVEYRVRLCCGNYGYCDNSHVENIWLRVLVFDDDCRDG